MQFVAAIAIAIDDEASEARIETTKKSVHPA